MKIAVVGASGAMGSFFVRYFLRRGFEVTGSDRKRAEFPSRRFKYYRSNAAAVQGAEFTILATPIDETLRAAKEIVQHLRRGSTLVELCSVKWKILPELRRLASANGVRLLSTHPLFGPGTKSIDGWKIMVLASRGSSDLGAARRLFQGAILVPVNRQEHDRLMSVTLSLQHALNIVYAGALSQYVSPTEFREFATPNSLVQLSLSEGLLSQSPVLYSYIQVGNRHSKRIVDSLAREVAKIQKFVDSNDRKGFEGYFRHLARIYGDDARSHGVSEKLYDISRQLRDE